MHELTLIGVHEDGDHVVLRDALGKRYRLRLDEALRAAVRRDRPRLGQLQIEMEGGLRPRDVQALIRAGLSAEEVAQRSGWTEEKVRRFEGPILAEREFMARRARAAAVTRDGSQTLDERVEERLRARGVHLKQTRWDSLRKESGRWIVSLEFVAGDRERVASWRFDPRSGELRALNDDARWLSEDEKAGPLPGSSGRDRGSGDEVFDVMAPQRSVRRPKSARPAPPTDGDDELTESLRAHHATVRGRRGRARRGASATTHDHGATADILPLPSVGTASPTEPTPTRESPAGAGRASTADADAGHSGATEQRARADAPGTEPSPPDPTTDARASTSPSVTEPARKGRPRVPSWDDVVFGTRPRAVPPPD